MKFVPRSERKPKVSAGAASTISDGTASGMGRSQLAEACTLLAAVLRAGGWRFIVVVLLSVWTASLESAAFVAFPLLLKGGIKDGKIPGLDFALGTIDLPIMLTGYVGLTAVIAGLIYVQAVTSTRLVIDYGDGLKMRLQRAIMSAGWGTPVLAKSADLVHALTSEAGQCSYAVQIAINATGRLLTLPPLLIAAVVLSPGFTIAAVVLTMLASLPMMPLNRRAYDLARTTTQATRAVHAEITDQIAGLRILKILRAESNSSDEFHRRLAGVGKVQLAQTGATALVRGGQRVLAAAAASVGGYYGLVVLHLETGTLIAIVLVFVRLTGSLSGIQDLWRQLAWLLPVHGQLAKRLAECLQAAEPEPAETAPRLRRAIRLDAVDFTYFGSKRPVFSKIDLVVPASSTTALAGPSGAGKSTLADLVMGLTTPEAGRISVDDETLDGPARVAWRSRVAYVPQDPFLFHDTIRANLLLAKPAATEAELVTALEGAAARFVLQLPEGLETMVGDRGARLSGGERQRIVLARALLMAPDLLVLDEATNALDSETERQVIETLRALNGRMTILLIAHRRSALDLADRVIWIEAGRVVNQPSEHKLSPAPNSSDLPNSSDGTLDLCGQD